MDMTLDQTTPYQLTADSQDYLRVVALTSNQSDDNLLYTHFPADGKGKGNARVRLVARVANLWQAEDVVKQYNANVFIVDHQAIRDENGGEALMELIRRLRFKAESPVITVGVCYSPAWVRNFEQMGTLMTLNGPLNGMELQRLIEELPIAMNHAMQERLAPEYIPKFGGEAVGNIQSTRWKSQKI